MNSFPFSWLLANDLTVENLQISLSDENLKAIIIGDSLGFFLEAGLASQGECGIVPLMGEDGCYNFAAPDITFPNELLRGASTVSIFEDADVKLKKNITLYIISGTNTYYNVRFNEKYLDQISLALSFAKDKTESEANPFLDSNCWQGECFNKIMSLLKPSDYCLTNISLNECLLAYKTVSYFLKLKSSCEAQNYNCIILGPAKIELDPNPQYDNEFSSCNVEKKNGFKLIGVEEDKGESLLPSEIVIHNRDLQYQVFQEFIDFLNPGTSLQVVVPKESLSNRYYCDSGHLDYSLIFHESEDKQLFSPDQFYSNM